MEMNKYQSAAATTRLSTADREYLLLNLSGEVGELLSKFAKSRRDGTTVDLSDISKELGDILWHVAIIARDHGLSLSEVAETNLNKLRSRKNRDVISGSGDNR